jgi:hypothetical protein
VSLPELIQDEPTAVSEPIEKSVSEHSVSKSIESEEPQLEEQPLKEVF